MLTKIIIFMIMTIIEIIHPIFFSSKNIFINYNPHTIEDYFEKILPYYIIDMSLFNNYYLLGVISIYICLIDEIILNSFMISRLIRIIAIYLVQFPNPYKNAHIERSRVHDLIISGHTIHWNLIYIYLYNNYYIISCILLPFIFIYYLYIIKHKHHYSIDVFLGLYVSYSSYLICKKYNI